MRVAVVLYGQPRDYVKGYNSIMSFIKTQEGCEFDFFYHVWKLNENEEYIHEMHIASFLNNKINNKYNIDKKDSYINQNNNNNLNNDLNNINNVNNDVITNRNPNNNNIPTNNNNNNFNNNELINSNNDDFSFLVEFVKEYLPASQIILKIRQKHLTIMA
jgi:hypothetical protein